MHCSEASLCLVQDLSEDELGKVFKSGLHLPLLRLVSKRWNALANSCTDSVTISLTDAAWPHHLGAEDIGQPGAKAAFSTLCHVL